MVASFEEGTVNLIKLSIPGAFVLESPIRTDSRGSFREWFKRPDFESADLEFPVQQANLSISKRNVVRGLHYSLAPEGQAKVVSCAFGELDDILVDIRVDSPAFGTVEVVHLSADQDRSVYVAPGLAHGYCVTSEVGAFVYLLSSIFNPSMELDIHPLDETLNVPWPLSDKAILSDKDAVAPSLEHRRSSGELPHFPRGDT